MFKRVVFNISFFLLLVFPLCFLMSVSVEAMGRTPVEQPKKIKVEEVKMPETPWADKYFYQEGEQLYTLTKKIEMKQPISVDEVKALPDGALNKRYAGDITLLFFALNVFNAQAIDVLLEAGADPYITDSPTGSKRDFTYYFSLYDKNDTERYTGEFVNSNIKSYLKHGGDPNHILNFPIVARVAMSGNYEGTRLFVEAGADIFEDGDQEGFSTVFMLATDSFKEGEILLSEFIDKGYLSEKELSKIKELITNLGPIGPKNSEVYFQRNAWAKLNVEKLLYLYPEILNGEAEDSFFNKQLRYIFDGPVPWKDILHKNFTNPLTGKRDGGGR